MILVDAGPLVALFDARDQHHERCRRLLETLDDKLITTVPVLTEAMHLLGPGSPGPPKLMAYIRHGGLAVVPLDADRLRRCFDLMLQYADVPMDFADASIVSIAERLGTERVFTIDRRHFFAYRIRRGYHNVPFKVVGTAPGPHLVREGVGPAHEAAAADGGEAADQPPPSKGPQQRRHDHDHDEDDRRKRQAQAQVVGEPVAARSHDEHVRRVRDGAGEAR